MKCPKCHAENPEAPGRTATRACPKRMMQKPARPSSKEENQTKMKTLSADTSLKAEEIQISLIRESSISKRLRTVNSLVQATRWLSWRAISERYPDQTERFRVERYVNLLYDDESLARRVGRRLFGKD